MGAYAWQKQRVGLYREHRRRQLSEGMADVEVCWHERAECTYNMGSVEFLETEVEYGGWKYYLRLNMENCNAAKHKFDRWVM